MITDTESIIRFCREAWSWSFGRLSVSCDTRAGEIAGVSAIKTIIASAGARPTAGLRTISARSSKVATRSLDSQRERWGLAATCFPTIHIERPYRQSRAPARPSLCNRLASPPPNKIPRSAKKILRSLSDLAVTAQPRHSSANSRYFFAAGMMRSDTSICRPAPIFPGLCGTVRATAQAKSPQRNLSDVTPAARNEGRPGP